MKKHRILALASIVCLFMGCGQKQLSNADRIQPYTQNPQYWQYRGKPILLRGISWANTLFQISDWEEKVKQLKEAGCNYVQVNMCITDENHTLPFIKDSTSGLLDLNRFNDEYWIQFENVLHLTSREDVIVHIDLGITSDSVLQPILLESNQQAILAYQKRMADKILNHTLKYGHVIYGMDTIPDSSEYGLEDIKAQAKKIGVEIHTINMVTPEIEKTDMTRDKFTQFWKNIIHGQPLVRFHLDKSHPEFFEKIRTHIKSANMLLEKLNIFQCAPDLQNTLLINRASGEAYLSYSLNKQYAVYFPKEGSVDIDFANLTGIFEVRWLNIMSSEWIELFQMPSGGIAKLSTPGPGSWIVLLSK